MNPDDVKAGARLVALAMSPDRRPSTGNEYGQLIDRALTDDSFVDLIRAIARGFELEILALDPKAGLVLGTTDETPFKTSISDLVPKKPDRPVYLLAQLLIAAEAFPGPHDLDDVSFIGRVSVDRLDDRAREAIAVLDQRAAETGATIEPPVGQPGLEPLWRYYARRPAKTAESGASRTTTRVLIKRALDHLRTQGMLTHSSNEAGGTYTTTAKYRIHVRELAGYALLEELAALGIVAMPTTPAVDPATPRPDQTLPTL